MIDTHAHLNWPEFADNIAKVVDKSQQAGLSGIIIASSNITDSTKSIELANMFPGYLYASVGIHPQQTDPNNLLSVKQQLTTLEKIIVPPRRPPACLQGDALQESTPIVAIGECGLDYSPAPPGEKDRPNSEQLHLFRGQIEISLKYNLPLIIHARQANDEVIQILSDYPKAHGVFHCYSGGKKRITKILHLPNDWYFGFDGNLTYDKGLQAVIKEILTDRLLIETDAPFLSPAPFRGRPNQPAYLKYIQETINAIFMTNLTNQIVENSITLFHLPVYQSPITNN